MCFAFSLSLAYNEHTLISLDHPFFWKLCYVRVTLLATIHKKTMTSDEALIFHNVELKLLFLAEDFNIVFWRSPYAFEFGLQQPNL